MYSAVGLPQGIQCNPNQPRCPFESTPTDGQGNFAPLGGSFGHCAPWYNWGGNGTAERPAKGMTLMAGGPGKTPIPPLYRNPVFFTAGGAPGTTFCTATSTGLTRTGRVESRPAIRSRPASSSRMGRVVPRAGSVFPPRERARVPGSVR
jgi:hypothetical protein